MKLCLKTISFMLACIVLGGTVLGCAVKTPDDNRLSANDAITDVFATEAETATETAYIDGMADKNYDGATYTIGAPASYNLSPEELNGETINDAVYAQMINVEEKFNCNIEVTEVNQALVKASIQAGDKAFQLISGGTSGDMASYVTTGLVHNLYKFKDIDFTKPWWNQNTVKNLSLNNKLYMAFGDIFAERGITYTHTFYFNKKLAEDYGVNAKVKELYGEDSIYDLVRSGKWTIDALETLISGISVDQNGDGKMSFSDTYGLGQSIPVSGVYRTAFDCLIMTPGVDGYPELTINNDKFNEIVPRIYSLCFENENVLEGSQAEEPVLRDAFVAGQLVFYSGFLCDVNQLRGMDDEFGVLPLPKWNETQSAYYTTVRGDNYFVGVPVSVGEEDYEFVGQVTEALAYYGRTLVRQAVYDDTLKGKMTRDEDSIEMLDILTDGIIIEYTFAHANDSGFSYVLWNLLNNKSNSFSAYYERKIKAATKYYERLKNIYTEME